jgi:hypothetical protein
MGSATALGKSWFAPLSRRYRDAYGMAAGTVSFGNLVKRGSFVLAGLVSFAALYVNVRHYEYSGYHLNWSGFLLGQFVAAVTLASGYISGTFIAAQGQFMSAMLDTAVNTSPHLQDSEKASIMGL